MESTTHEIGARLALTVPTKSAYLVDRYTRLVDSYCRYQSTDYAASDAEDPMVTFELTDQVRETIQQTLYRLLAGRRNIFFG